VALLVAAEVAMKIGFIGGGRLAHILLEAWARAGVQPLEVLVSEPSEAAQSILRARHPKVRFANAAQVLNQDLVFVALHPPAFRAFLAEGRHRLGPQTILVSLAPSLDFQELSKGLGGHTQILRMIPNAPSLIGKGYNTMALGPALPRESFDKFRSYFETMGACPEVPETHLEAYAILCAMGPTYFWPQIQALRELGQRFGLPAEAIAPALDGMLRGSLDLLPGSDLDFESVMDLIPSKPLQAAMPGILEAYHQALPALHARITERP
jgi:pyrroline-5-carboxylate reductase